MPSLYEAPANDDAAPPEHEDAAGTSPTRRGSISWALVLLLALLALPLVGAGLTFFLVWQVVRSWKEHCSGWFVRIHITLILVASLSFLFFLHTWNLLGYRL